MTLVITGEECTDGEYNQLWEKLSEMVTNLFVSRICTTKLVSIMQSLLEIDRFNHDLLLHPDDITTQPR